MKATTKGFVVHVVLALSTLLNSALSRQRSLQNVPFSGIGSVRPLRLRSPSSFSSPSPRSTLNGDESDFGWESSTNLTFSSSGASDAHASATNSSASSAVDVVGSSANSSSSSSSSSAVYAIETVFTNSSAGEGEQPESTNSSAPTNVSAVEQELIETLEVDKQVTGEGLSTLHAVHVIIMHSMVEAGSRLKRCFQNIATYACIMRREALDHAQRQARYAFHWRRFYDKAAARKV